MLFTLIAQDYLLWHYTRAFGEFFRVWLNLLWFTIHFFSLPDLFRSWFAPFKRITEERQKGDPINEYFAILIVNLLSRVVGATMRTCLILVGLICLLVMVLFGLVTYLLWVFLPIASVILLISGLTLLLI
jgi:hypothetical protein